MNNFLIKDFLSSNLGVDMNDFNVMYDVVNWVIIIKSIGGGIVNFLVRLMFDKILDLKYKLCVNNVLILRKVIFNDILIYKIYI